MQEAQTKASPFEIFAELHHAELRSAAAEVVAAVAHAVGTPLNVISGRAELIRQDPSNALAQVVKIEEQVHKMATGLRQLVDYLAPPELPSDIASARQLLDEVRALVAPLLENAAELTLEDAATAASKVNRTGALSTLTTLVLWADRSRAETVRAGSVKLPEVPNGPGRASVAVSASLVDGYVAFDLELPWLPLVEGWRLENFAQRPLETMGSAPYRWLSVCGAIARGQGNRLVVEASPCGQGSRVRYSCKTAQSA